MKYTLLLFCFFIVFNSWSQEDLFDLNNSKKYADYLLSSGQYEASISEFERVVFLDTTDLEAKLKLISSYRLGEQFEKGVKRVPFLFEEPKDMPRPHALEYSKLLMSARSWEAARGFWNTSSKLPEQDKHLLQSTLFIFESDFVKAQEALNMIQTVGNPLKDGYTSIVESGLNGKRKSPFLAGLLSATIPGLGKVYTGDWKDAIVSLIFTGGMAFQAVRNFNNHGSNDFRPWAYTTIGTGFYIGNIVGSVKSAKDRNRKRINLLQHEASDYFNSYY